MKYLIKANNDLISFCECEPAFISSPGQADCPWCGCGWLFTCNKCRKAFTFAVPIEIDRTKFQQLALEDLTVWMENPPDAEIQNWMEYMENCFSQHLQEDKTYVYLDGFAIPTDETNVSFEGIHARHHLDYIPQVRALSDKAIMDDLLNNRDYWLQRAIQRDEKGK